MVNKKTKSAKKPRIIGLTGSIGMGKSTVSSQIRKLGWRVHSADEAVAILLEKKNIITKIARFWPEAVVRGKVDRQILGALVFADKAAKAKLEALLHPLVIKSEEAVLKKAAQKGEAAVFLDIPLLFETGAEKRCDFVLCVSASPDRQRARVLAREGMSEEKFKAILKSQLSDREKRKRSNAVLSTNGNPSDNYKQLIKLWPQMMK